jgi:lysophospholipase L1-like esterase
VARDLRRLAAGLREANPDVRIVVTLSPDMGAVPRLAQPLRAVAGRRARQLNGALREVVRSEGLTQARILEETGPAFRADPGLFSADRFHPDARGYAVWVPVLTEALDAALVSPSARSEAAR